MGLPGLAFGGCKLKGLGVGFEVYRVQGLRTQIWSSGAQFKWGSEGSCGMTWEFYRACDESFLGVLDVNARFSVEPHFHGLVFRGLSGVLASTPRLKPKTRHLQTLSATCGIM